MKVRNLEEKEASSSRMAATDLSFESAASKPAVAAATRAARPSLSDPSVPALRAPTVTLQVQHLSTRQCRERERGRGRGKEG